MDQVHALKLSEKLPHIRQNAEDIEKLRKRVDALDTLRVQVINLDDQTQKLSADVQSLKESVDKNDETYVKGMEKNHISSNRNMIQIDIIWKEIRKMQDMSVDKEDASERGPDHSNFLKELEGRILQLEEDSCRQGETRVSSLEQAIKDLHIKIENMPKGGGTSNFDEDAFMIRYRKDLELYAKKADLEHTRTDFGMWCNKYQKELERKLNRDELANFEQRLIEILSQSFADKVQNDKDHAKIFKKLQKLWGLVNS